MIEPEMFSLAGEELPAEPEVPQFTEEDAMVALRRLDPLYQALSSPSWVDIANHLAEMLETALDEAVRAEEHPRVIAAQARVKLLRELLDLPDHVHTEIARYRESIETGKD